ncbi:MAG TPA: NUDIX hydrolase [Mycobacteriales bacterium]|jgi:8-oxo-dGTP pyrophosphatase MutT (NUDIX family)|nr:NUDIX hydrolase [Mycobacteriales bacterium]
MGFEVPAAIAEQVLARAAGEVSPPRDAATVVLLRDGAAGIEVYLLRRVRAMAAFGGMTVFPGGGVDPADVADVSVPWVGPEPDEWCRPLSAGTALARGLVCAAVRETFEESGVLLAGPGPDEVVADTAAWEDERKALEARTLSLSALFADRGLHLRADLLRPWSHWITPEIEHRRFDTRFFVAALPAGQRARDVSGEADHAAWVRPADALAQRERGERVMVPPTAMTLEDLTAYDTVADVLAAAPGRRIEPVLPRLERGEDGGLRFLVPGDPGYGA